MKIAALFDKFAAIHPETGFVRDAAILTTCFGGQKFLSEYEHF